MPSACGGPGHGEAPALVLGSQSRRRVMGCAVSVYVGTKDADSSAGRPLCFALRSCRHEMPPIRREMKNMLHLQHGCRCQSIRFTALIY